MKVYVMVDLPAGTDATSVADALTEIAEAVSARGYTDGERDRLAPCTIGEVHGCRPAFVISRIAPPAQAESALQFVFDACARLNDSQICDKLRSADNLESTVDSLAEELTDIENNAGRALAAIRGE